MSFRVTEQRDVRRPWRSAPIVALLIFALLAIPGAPSIGADEPYAEELAVRITPPIILAA